MPKQTFLNLPEEKQNTIIDVAINEFAEYGFESASTNRIVEKSGISKGSFYQCFEDKLDVFMHLIDLFGKEKTEFFADKHPPSANMDTFTYFHWMIKTGMEFESVHPHLAQAITRVLLRDGMYYGKYFIEERKKTTLALKMMIEQAIERGEVDPSVEVDLAVMVMETWSNAISTYVLNESMQEEDFMTWLRLPKTQERIDKLLYVMEYGLRNTESQFIADAEIEEKK